MRQTVAYKILMLQCIVLGTCILLSSFGEKVVLHSTILGALLFLIPQTYFMLKFFQINDGKFARVIVRNFYIGEAVKVALTAAGFVVVFTMIKPLNYTVLILTYASGHLFFWFAPWFELRLKKG